MSEDICFRHCIITGHRCKKTIDCIDCKIAIEYFGGDRNE